MWASRAWDTLYPSCELLASSQRAKSICQRTSGRPASNRVGLRHLLSVSGKLVAQHRENWGMPVVQDGTSWRCLEVLARVDFRSAKVRPFAERKATMACLNPRASYVHALGSPRGGPRPLFDLSRSCTLARCRNHSLISRSWSMTSIHGSTLHACACAGPRAPRTSARSSGRRPAQDRGFRSAVGGTPWAASSLPTVASFSTSAG